MHGRFMPFGRLVCRSKSAKSSESIGQANLGLNLILWTCLVVWHPLVEVEFDDSLDLRAANVNSMEIERIAEAIAHVMPLVT